MMFAMAIHWWQWINTTHTHTGVVIISSLHERLMIIEFYNDDNDEDNDDNGDNDNKINNIPKNKTWFTIFDR